MRKELSSSLLAMAERFSRQKKQNKGGYKNKEAHALEVQ